MEGGGEGGGRPDKRTRVLTRVHTGADQPAALSCVARTDAPPRTQCRPTRVKRVSVARRAPMRTDIPDIKSKARYLPHTVKKRGGGGKDCKETEVGERGIF